MRLSTREQTKLIDSRARAERGLPAEILMEAAGALAAREIAQSFLPEVLSGRDIAIACGPGGNGADGLVVARHLRAAGCRRAVAVLCAPEAKRVPLFRAQLARARACDVAIIDALAEGDAERGAGAWEIVERAALAIDALFGVGLNAPVREPYARAIGALNARKGPVASLDVPSGLDCDRGVASGAEAEGQGLAVRATATFCFGLARPGFFVSDGPRLVGRLRRLPIGIPQSLGLEVANTHFAFAEREARLVMPRRGATSNKSTHGRALILAGHGEDHAAMWGAGLLASAAAYRVGAGYATWASWENPAQALAQLPEALTAAISDELLARERGWTAVVIGPGLGAGPGGAGSAGGGGAGTGGAASASIEGALGRLREQGFARVVIDADALAAVARGAGLPLPATWIATPHAGELGRILGVDARAIEADRYLYASEGARRLGCRVLLKGFRTVLAQPEAAGGQKTVILSGNAALAKAGTGDVLAGAIGGLLAQGLEPDAAACLGAYVHGRVADEWVSRGRGRAALSASDVRDLLPAVIAELERPLPPAGASL